MADNKWGIDQNRIKVIRSEKYGSHLIAARDLQPGEFLFQELPLVVGPLPIGSPVCLGCHRHVTYPWNRCSKCGAPVCGSQCEEKAEHQNGECQFFQKNPESNIFLQSNDMELILALRLWLLLQNSKENGDCELFVCGTIGKTIEFSSLNRLKYIVRTCEEVKEARLQAICDIVDKFALDVRPRGFNIREVSDANSFFCRALYLKTSLLTHGCVANIQITVDSHHNLKARTSSVIPEGTRLMLNYVRASDATSQRQRNLREDRHTSCECCRCSDPTELGTFVSGIKCVKCDSGYWLPDHQNCFNKNGIWKCTVCSSTIGSMLADTTVICAQNTLSSTLPTLKSVEDLLQTLGYSLHPNHSVMLEGTQMLIKLYSSALKGSVLEGDPSNLTVNMGHINRQIQLCQQMLDITQVLEPGLSRTRGVLLYELHLPIVLKANYLFDKEEINNNDLLLKLEEAEKVLGEAARLLIYDPLDTPEGLVAKSCLQSLQELRNYITAVKDEQKISNEINKEKKSAYKRKGKNKKHN